MGCPSDIRSNISVNSTALVNWTEPVARDNSNLAPNVTVVPPGINPPHIFNKSTVVVYTARDASGNKGECSFKVVLEGESDIYFVKCMVSYAKLIFEIMLKLCRSLRLRNHTPALFPRCKHSRVG